MSNSRRITSKHDTSRLFAKMFCQSHRARHVVLGSRSSLPVTYPYLISDPLPAGVTQLGIRIVSRDQGSSGNLTAGRWTWFEVSFLRSQTGNPSVPIVSDGLHLIREAPEAFRQVFQQSGWELLELFNSSDAACVPERSSHRSLTLFANAEAPGWVTQSRTILFGPAPNGLDGQPDPKNLTFSAQEGDRVVVWARAQVCATHLVRPRSTSNIKNAQFPGSVNYIAEIHIGLSGVVSFFNLASVLVIKPHRTWMILLQRRTT
jgi:hypothetical protein